MYAEIWEYVFGAKVVVIAALGAEATLSSSLVWEAWENAVRFPDPLGKLSVGEPD